MPPIPKPSEYAPLRQKLDWAALAHYVRMVDREEGQNAILQYAHEYAAGDVADLKQAMAHAELLARGVEQKIQAARIGR